MRRRRDLGLSLAALIGLVTALSAPDVQADFNPFGRKPKGGGTAAPRTNAPKAPKAPSTPKTPTAQPGEGTKPTEEAKPKNEVPSDALIARYTAIVLTRPAEPFPLQRLAELYRERDGDLTKLVEDFERRAAQPGSEHYNALVALAGVYKQDARVDRAIDAYEKAITERPTEVAAVVALANLLNDRGDKAAAKTRYEQALPHLKDDATREQVLRTLMSLSLDVNDYDGAKRYHDELVKKAGGSFFVRAELGRELLTRGEYGKAETEFRALVKAAAGDNRAVAPALKDLGRALAGQKKRTEALEVLRRALDAAGQQSGLRREIFDTVVEVYRAEDKLIELIALLEKEHPNDFERLGLLGNLYEETGQVDKALATYRRALGVNRDDISTRLKVVQLLQVQGDLEGAIAEYENLIRAAPRNPEFVFQLAEALIQRGERARALAHLSRLEARSQGDEDTLAALVDFYERVDEADKARALLERLAGSHSGDPRHLIELGDRYFREGNEKRALEVWQRIKLVVPDRATALHTVGEVYLEHDLTDLALEALKQAVDLSPKDAKFKKAYALALERSGSAGPNTARDQRYEEALRTWEGLLRDAGNDENTAREARQHIVTLWSLSRQLEQRVRPLERRFASSPPDLDAGRLLAEVYFRLRRYSDAERTLQGVIKAAPGDTPSHLQLERVLALEHKLDTAITLLEKLVKLDPKRAREYYQRMAQYSAELYRDDDAVTYAAKAVELSPEDAEGHRKLGEMYLRHQDVDRAVREFRNAISKNDRLFPVYFQLAELLLNRGNLDEADKLLRRVMRATPDEELIGRAVRLSMQINLSRGTIESLEKELLPVALGNPQKPVYRRLLVEIYGNLAFPLVHGTHSPDLQQAEAARAALRKIGERAVKPLLDALADERDSQQRTAIELLSHIRNRSAGPALFNYATGPADAALRTRAMIAIGALEDAEMLPKLASVVLPDAGTGADETDTIAIAAAWGVAKLRHASARPILVRMLDSDAPSVSALGAIGLGLLHSRRDAAALGTVVRTAEAGSLARAAAAFALGEVGDRSQEEALRELAEATDPVARGAAILALARLGSETSPHAIAHNLISDDSALRDAATAAALVLATKDYRTPADPLPIPDGKVDVRAIVAELRPTKYTPDEHVDALVRLAPELARACASTAQSSPDGARRVADALLVRNGEPAFGTLTEELDRASPAAKERAKSATLTIAAAVVAPFLALAKHPAANARTLAVQFLASRKEPPAHEAVLAALEDPDPSVKRAALAAVGASRDPRAIGVVTELLQPDVDWPLRVRATEALGEVAAGSANQTAFRALEATAITDSYALVREAAVRALHRVDPSHARTTLERVVANDPEPKVRNVAKGLLQKH